MAELARAITSPTAQRIVRELGAGVAGALGDDPPGRASAVAVGRGHLFWTVADVDLRAAAEHPGVGRAPTLHLAGLEQCAGVMDSDGDLGRRPTELNIRGG